MQRLKSGRCLRAAGRDPPRRVVDWTARPRKVHSWIPCPTTTLRAVGVAATFRGIALKGRVLMTTIRRGVWVVVLVVGGMIAGVALDRQVLAGLVPAGGVPLAATPDFRLIAEAWNLIHREYVDRSAVKSRPLTYGAISGMVDALGDTGHSTFLSPEMVADSKEEMAGHFAGIGAEVRMKDKHLVIVTPLDGSPAKKAGLQPGDQILKVNGKDVAGLSLEKAVNLIKGPAGTRVRLTVRSPKADKSRNVVIVRATIAVPPVTWDMMPGTHIAHVRLAVFSDGATQALRKALGQAKRAGALGVVLDLRNNPGGLLDEAVGVASLFLSDGNVLLEKNSKGKVHPVPVRADERHFKMPLVVLVNKGTASASEIVAGALQDAHRAKLVGETTFGTGTVLREFPLTDGSALMLAVQEWLTPDHHVIWHKGIVPNLKSPLQAGVIPLLPTKEAKMDAAQFKASKDTQLKKALRLLETADSVVAAKSTD